MERVVSISESSSASSTSSESSVNSSVVKEVDDDDNVDDDEEGDVCRICRNPGNSDDELRYPCACSGTIKYVHQVCLLQWLNHSKATHCHVCKHQFEFSPVYPVNAPPRLTSRELILAIGVKACNFVKFLTRLSFLLSVWPITFFIWRIVFVKSFGEAQRLFFAHISLTVILTDCLHGCLLYATIFSIFVGAAFLRHLPEDGGAQDGEEAQDGEDGARPPGQANRNLVADVNVGHAGGAQVIADGAENIRFDDLFNIAFCVLGINMIFLGVVIFVPFSLGRIILYYMSWMLSSAISPAAPLKESALSLVNITYVVANLTSETQENGELGHVAEMLSVNSPRLNGTSNDLTSGMSTEFLKGQFVGASTFSDVTTLAVGYLFIFSIVFFYFGLVPLIRYTRGERSIAARFHGLASIVEAIHSPFRQFILAMRHLMTILKVAFLLVIKFGVFPLMYGWWLDVCTIRMFGKSFAQRVDFFSVSPLTSSLVHWVMGILQLLQIGIFVILLAGVLRPGVLLCDPVHNHGRRILLSVAAHGSLTVMLVFLPVKLAMRVSPSIFPLDISISDPFTEIPVVMLLFHICIPFAIKHFKLSTTVKSLLSYWFTTVGWSLGLKDFLLPRPEYSGGHGDPARQDRVHGRLVEDRGFRGLDADNINMANHAIANTDISGNENDVQVEAERCSFVIRIVLLLVVAWMTLLMFNCALIIVPIPLGRALFNGIPFLPITHGIKCNDIYAFIIGNYVIWTIIAGVRYCIEHIRSRKAKPQLKEISKWGGIVLKSYVLLTIWILVIPVLIGLLFELLVIVPMRVPVDESPVFLLYQDWALGLLFLKIWTRLVMIDHMMLLANDSWRMKFERVRRDGFSRLQGFWIMREIVLPIITKLLTALCVPYVLARGVFPVLGYPFVVNSAVYRFAWLGCFGFISLFYCAKRSHVWFANLHNSIRDDRYLIGWRIRNFGEDREQQRQRADADGAIHVQHDQEDADLGLIHRHIIVQQEA